MATKRPARSTRSKAEVQTEFEAARAGVHSAEPVAPTEAALRAQRNEAVRNATKEVSVEAALKSITDLGLNVQKSLAGVSEQLTAEVRQLQDLREAVKLEAEELDRLYKIDVAKTSIENLVAEYDQKQRELEQHHAERVAQLNKEYTELQARIDALEAETGKDRQREEEEYQYRTAQQHRDQEDVFAQKLKTKERELTEMEERRYKALTEREALLKTREVKQAELEKQVAEIPMLISKAEKTAEAITTNRLTRDYEHKMQLAAMESANNAKVAQQTIDSLRATIEAQTKGLETLRAELAAANTRAENIAAKALEASSGQQALQVAMQTAAQRENNLPNGKRA